MAEMPFRLNLLEDSSLMRRINAVKIIPVLLPLLMLLSSFNTAQAIDPGKAQGSLQINGTTIQITHAYVQLHDNAEGLLDLSRELRILLVDRGVPQDSLNGIVFLPVTEMARLGKVQGILIRLDPGRPNTAYVTLLYPPKDRGASLMTLTIGGTGNALKRLSIGGNRAAGEAEHRDDQGPRPGELPAMNYAVLFDAPLFNEPSVTADIRGKAAQNSPQAAILRRKVKAMQEGDFEALKGLTSEKANRQNDAFIANAGPDVKEMMKAAGRDMEQSIKNISRVVVRGRQSVVIFSGRSWANFVLEGNDWKSDD